VVWDFIHLQLEYKIFIIMTNTISLGHIIELELNWLKISGLNYFMGGIFSESLAKVKNETTWWKLTQVDHLKLK
jgi:hypothetical protein